MKNYFTIISAIIRPEINENISLGLLIVTSERVFLGISKNKLSIVKDLLPTHLYQGIKNEIRGIQELCNKEQQESKIALFSKVELPELQANYISYLNNYKNNIISFSAPQSISSEINHKIFNILFEKFIDDKIYATEKEGNNSIETFRREFIPTLKHFFNTNITIGSDIFLGAISPLKFDLAGKNEIPVFVKSIDLERRKYNVEHDINFLYPLKNLSPESKKFIVTKEPHQNFGVQHEIWQNLKNSDWLEYIDISEVDKLREYAELHHVVPLFKE